MISPKKLYIIPGLFLLVLLITGIWLKKTMVISISIISFLILLSCFTLDKFKQNYTQPRLRTLLSNLVEKFNENDIKYWVDYGSLLGIVRDGDIIKHDTDTDICLFPDNPDIEKKLIKIVNELGPLHNLVYLTRGKTPETHLFRIYANEDRFLAPIYADIYLTKLENNAYVDLSGKLPKHLLGNTKKLVWNGVSVIVPEKIHETLVWRYGESYLTPDRFKSNERFRKILAEEGFTNLRI